MDPKNLTAIVNVVAIVLGSLAATNVFPVATPFLSAVAGLLAGWVNAQKPGTAAKIEAAKESK